MPATVSANHTAKRHGSKPGQGREKSKRRGSGTWGSVVFPEGGGVVADHLRTKPPLLQMNESFRSFATKIC